MGTARGWCQAQREGPATARSHQPGATAMRRALGSTQSLDIETGVPWPCWDVSASWDNGDWGARSFPAGQRGAVWGSVWAGFVSSSLPGHLHALFSPGQRAAGLETAPISTRCIVCRETCPLEDHSCVPGCQCSCLCPRRRSAALAVRRGRRTGSGGQSRARVGTEGPGGHQEDGLLWSRLCCTAGDVAGMLIPPR